MTKLTKLQQAAQSVCDTIQKRGELLFVADWKKSTYGYCPSIFAWNQKVSFAGGCGYDKESAALASFLCFLFEAPTKIKGESYQDLLARSSNAKIASLGGVGFDAIAEELKKNGWLLHRNHASETITAYQIKRVGL